jgi:hypothetical protein
MTRPFCAIVPAVTQEWIPTTVPTELDGLPRSNRRSADGVDGGLL